MARSNPVSQEPSRPSVVGPILFGIVGMALGAGLAESAWGALSGGALGFLYANQRTLRARIAALQHLIAESQPRGPVEESDSDRVDAGWVSPASDADRISDGRSGEEDSGDVPPLEDAVSAAFARRRSTAVSSSVPPGPTGPASAAPTAPPGTSATTAGNGRARGSASSSPAPGFFDPMVRVVRGFFFGGNTVVRVGLLVLLVGIALLAKYAAENALFPVEARLALAALVGLGLTGLGFRLRVARPGFGMSLQGGGVAALYLVTFFAFRVYGLLPAGFAFGLFVALALATALLSHLQSSEALLVIGSLGGFLAPILASTGSGHHVVLFAYYLILNVSIAAVAWRQTWRVPALVAFVCTYAVATTWGVLRYEPRFLTSTEPFVVAFMMLFTAIAVLHAWRRPPHLRGFVDGTLVFGTPFVSILLEAALVRDRELGLALAAAGFGLFYAGTAVFVWRVGSRALRPLAEAFVALAVGFATMAIPFAFEGSLTISVAWALEGAGLYWVGARQGRAFPRLVGVGLQGAAAIAFVTLVAFGDTGPDGDLPILNGQALSCLSMALAGLFIAYRAWVRRATLGPIERSSTWLLGAWGLVWWTVGSLDEIDRFVAPTLSSSARVLWLAGSTFVLELGSARWNWRPGRMMTLASLPGALLFFVLFLDEAPHLLADGGWLVWPPLFVTFLFLWQRLEETNLRALSLFRSGCLWFFAFFLATALSGLVRVGAGFDGDWEIAAFGVGLAGMLFGAMAVYERGRAPFDRDRESALLTGLAPVAGFALATILAIQFEARGDAPPLPHLPILNPIDLVVWLLALSVWRVWQEVDRTRGDSMSREQRRAVLLAACVVAFAALNGILVRAVHQWAGVPFSKDALWDSVAMQVSLSIAWTLLGMTGMLISSRRGWREAWMGFAGLLGIVVAKLFSVDLSQLSTLARIGTFLAVGALLLVLGYLSPVPPGSGGKGPSDSVDPEGPGTGSGGDAATGQGRTDGMPGPAPAGEMQ